MFANVWMGVRVEAHDAIVTRLRWDEESQGPYPGPVTDREHKVFRYMSDQDIVQRLFKNSIIAGKEWSLWSLSFTENLAQVKIELDQLLLDRPNHISIAGAWQWDGRQFGTQWTDETQTATTGTPTYPIPTAQLLKFMPDVGGSPATVLADVNLLFGQSPRRFAA